MNKEINCRHLWNQWSDFDPENEHVIEAKKRMAGFSREDWETMSEEITYIMYDMADIVKNKNADVKLPESEAIFDRLFNHLDKWFINVNKDYVRGSASDSILNKDYQAFFSKYGDGVNLYFYKLCDRYIHKIKD
jgi:hypothetical protein